MVTPLGTFVDSGSNHPDNPPFTTTAPVNRILSDELPPVSLGRPTLADGLREEIRQIIREMISVQDKESPFAAELREERRRREQLERRINELIEQDQRRRALEEEAARLQAIRAELERQGARKVELLLRFAKEDVRRDGDGELFAVWPGFRSEITLNEYVKALKHGYPELFGGEPCQS